MVILLHREDYYDKESPRAGEADLIVAKLHSVGTRADELAAAAAEVTRLARAVDDAVAQVCRARLPRQSSARARSGQPTGTSRGARSSRARC